MSRLNPAPSPVRYGRVAQGLHWAIALLIVFEIGLGWRMDGPPGVTTFAVYQLHKSIGISILLLTLARIAWRVGHRPPPAVGGHVWERRLAGGVHAGFYLLLLAIPLSGWLLVSASRTGIGTVLFGLIPFPHLPGVPGLEPTTKAGVEQAAETAHRLLGWALYGLLALHFAGALKHHLIDRDQGLARMLPGPSGVRLFSRRLVGVAVVVVLALTAAAAYPWLAQTSPAPASQPAATAQAEVLPAPVPAAVDPAAPPVEADAVETTAVPSRWTVNRAQSRLSFSTSQSGSPIRGRFADWSADILFSPNALEASRVRVTVAMASFTTEDSDSQGVLGGSQWFDTASHADAVFSADRFRALSGDRYEARGSLRLKGVSRPAVVRFSLKIEGDTARMSGTATLDRTAFGVGTGEWAGTDDIPAQVAVDTTIVATRADR